MTDTAAVRVNTGAPEAGDATALGWYFYGITRSGSVSTALAAADREHDVVAPLELLEISELAALVRRVRRDDFSIAALRERFQSAEALEEMVRSHNGVIEAVHAQQAILPAKFGIVHAHIEDVLSALRPVHDALLRRLDHLEGYDEWAVHLIADRALIREQVLNEHALIRSLREKRAAARPGRAYFLEQQIRDELESATELSLSALGQTAFERFGTCARERQMSERRLAAESKEDVEVLRASFLVARTRADAFMEEIRCVCDVSDGLRCECSGPWPPYSFAAWDVAGEAAR